MFPGQGSQSVGMAKFLFDNYSTAKQCFDEASETLKFDMAKLCFEGPESDLNMTENTQPALVTASTALFRVLKENSNLEWIASAGHSLGEYSACVANNSISFSDALRLVKERGKAMQEAVPVGVGAMVAAMGLDMDQIHSLCKWVESESGFSPIEAANFNAPGQTVLSGSAEAIQWLQNNFNPEVVGNPKRVKFIPLKVSAPFHCSLMKPAQDHMEKLLNDTKVNSPTKAIVQNVCASPIVNGDEIRKNLVLQVSSSVRWIETVEKLKDLGCKNLIEVGPGKVLSGLAKKIDSGAFNSFNVTNQEELDLLLKELN